jgi:peptidoglycan/xylan/chitin deacetylase (PgdA/CDA1 family)/glycosyltransferase involved in cell wall biosynthesis
MKYSIAIVSKNRHPILEDAIQALLAHLSSVNGYEIVVVEESPVPRPIRLAPVRYHWIPERHFGLGFARNYALERCSGEIVVFVDDDIRPHKGWFENLVHPFQNGEVAGVGGAVLPDIRHLNAVGKCISFLGFPAGGIRRWLAAGGKTRESHLISTGNCAFRRKFAGQINGFDHLLRGCEDSDFFERLTKTGPTLFVPTAVVFHKQRTSYKKVLQWFMKRGKNNFFYRCKDIGPVKSLLFPLRSNFNVKLIFLIAVFLAVFHTARVLAPLLLAGCFCAWCLFIWRGQKKDLVFRIEDKDLKPISDLTQEVHQLTVPFHMGLIKFLMDLGFEIGRLAGFFTYVQNRVFYQPVVLTFHRIAAGPDRPVHAKYTVTREAFYHLIEDIDRNGERLISLGELVWVSKHRPYCLFFYRFVAFTFDDAYLSVFRLLQDSFRDRRFPATIFAPVNCLGKIAGWNRSSPIDRDRIMNLEELQTLSRAGVEIGSHALTHPRLAELPEEDCKKEIFHSASFLCTHFPGTRLVLSYPFGSFDHRVMRLAAAAGYAGAVANFPGTFRRRINPWAIPRYNFHNDSAFGAIRSHAKANWLKNIARDLRDSIRIAIR